MELIPTLLQTIEQPLYDLPFIEANTVPVSLQDICNNHIIPVFTKDNETLISQHQFIETAYNEIDTIIKDPLIGPFIRVSHPVKGRIPSAIHKKSEDLLPHEETLYYERMMFVYIVPNMTRVTNGQLMHMVIGGVKAYNKDNLNKKNGALQHFTFFMGFQVKVCSNLCVWSDGVNLQIKVGSKEALGFEIRSILESYNPEEQLAQYDQWHNLYLKEVQFAHILGKCRMFQHLKTNQRDGIISPGISDSQLNLVAKNYFQDTSFSAQNGKIDLWSFYNLFTDALKSSYIDNMIDHNVHVGKFVSHVGKSIRMNEPTWYLP